LPFRFSYFDKIFCFGVLQHTPNVEKSFHTLPNYLKPGGQIAIDVYRKPQGLAGIFTIKYWVRPITKRIPAQKLYNIVMKYINLMWPIVKILNHYRFWDIVIHILLIADYTNIYSLSNKTLKEWAILDTFDMLSPIYDTPQSITTVQKWFARNDLIKAHVAYVDTALWAEPLKNKWIII